jgi:hypothetical protein
MKTRSLILISLKEGIRRALPLLAGVVVLWAALLIAGAAFAQETAAAAAAVPDAGGLSPLVQEYLPPLLIAIITLLTTAAAWLKSSTGKAIRQRVKNETAASALTWLTGVVFDYVGHAAQVTVAGLKADLADGKVSKEEYENRLKELKDTMVKDLLDAALGRLQSSGAVPDGARGLDIAKGIIDRKIETVLPAVKAARADPPRASVAA